MPAHEARVDDEHLQYAAKGKNGEYDLREWSEHRKTVFGRRNGDEREYAERSRVFITVADYFEHNLSQLGVKFKERLFFFSDKLSGYAEE